MGLQDIFKAAAQIIFTALDDVKISVIYRVRTSTYDPATGRTTPSDADYPITNCIRIDYEADEVDNAAVKPKDFKLMIPVDDLTPTPEIDHLVVIDSVEHNVVDFNKDPADAVWTIQVRA